MTGIDEKIDAILLKVRLIQQTVLNQQDILDSIVASNIQHQYLLNHGIEGFKDMILKNFQKQSKENTINRLHAIFMHDKDLTHPHKKVLSFLLDKYDYEKNIFGKVFFSKIVKHCRLGKNKAKEYLVFLIEKGYVQKHDDGYRVWYFISESLLPKEDK